MDFFLAMLIIVVVYFLPSAMAVKRNHESKWAIFILNLLAGWTLLGWVAAFIWSFMSQTAVSANNSSPVGVGDELQKLVDLKERGILTGEEFEKQKQRVLNTAPDKSAPRPENHA